MSLAGLAAACLSALLLGATGVEACSCGERTLCETFEFSAVVMQAIPFSRSNTTSVTPLYGELITYGVDVLTILKGESGVDYGDNHTFVTESSESFCGVYLELDTEYLIDFSRDEEDGLLHANSCGLARKWSSVNAIDLADLESGCGTSNSTMTDDDVDDDGGGASDGAGGTNGTTTDDSNSASDEEETPVDEQNNESGGGRGEDNTPTNTTISLKSPGSMCGSQGPQEAQVGLGVGLGVPPGGAIEGEQGRGQVPMMRTEWWWQPGPVTSCCWFFSLRTGVYMLALWNMITGVEYLRMEKTNIPALIELLAHDREKYMEYCAGHIIAPQKSCDAIVGNIAYREKLLDFWESSIPAYHAIGAVFLCFAMVGWRAGYTNSSKFAKVFMMAFPTALSIRIVLLALSPHQAVSYSLILISVTVTFAYFFKVAWSFYARVSLLEEANRVADGMEPPRPISITRSDTSGAAGVQLDASNA
eukprot:jgi/Undpi1/9534/HiC_scaffold_27.g11990.m1